MSMFGDITLDGVLDDINKKIAELELEEDVNEDVIAGLKLAKDIVYNSY